MKRVGTAREVMWGIEGALALVRDIGRDVELAGYGLALMGSVLARGYSYNDLDLVAFPLRAPDTAASRGELRAALEVRGWHRKHSASVVHAAWARRGSSDTKYVEVWLDARGRRVDLFLLT